MLYPNVVSNILSITLIQQNTAKLYFLLPQQKLPCLSRSFQWNSCPLFLEPSSGKQVPFQNLFTENFAASCCFHSVPCVEELCWEKLICILVNVSRGRCLESLKLHRNISLLPWSLAFWRKSGLVLWLLPTMFYFYISLPISFLVWGVHVQAQRHIRSGEKNACGRKKKEIQGFV